MMETPDHQELPVQPDRPDFLVRLANQERQERRERKESLEQQALKESQALKDRKVRQALQEVWGRRVSRVLHALRGSTSKRSKSTNERL